MSPRPPAEQAPPNSPRWLLPVTLVLLLGLAAWPLLATDDEPLLAWRGAEVWGHAWTWWWHGELLPTWPAGTELATGTASWPVIDPLPALLGAALSRTMSAVVAWNTVALTSIAGAFAGGWWLARRIGGQGVVGGVVLAMGPVFTGSLLSGLSEDAAIGLLAVALGLVVKPREHGTEPALPSWRWALATGLCLGLLAWCGPYLAWLAAAAALLAGALQLVGHPRAWARWLAAGALAALLATPPLLAQGARALTGVGHRRGLHLAGPEPLWQLNPWGQADLVAFFTPGAAALPADAVIRLHPTYLGLVVLGLALVAGRSRWWWLLLGALLLAPGEQFHVLGAGSGIPNPAAMALDWLPGGALLNHHARLFLLGQVALAALAALGAQRLAMRWRSAAVVPVVVLAVGLDYGLLAPVGWPLPAAPAAAPDFLSDLDALEPGKLLWLPTGGPGLSPQRPLLDQRVHGRPLALDPNHPGAPYWLPRTPLGAWLASLGRDPDATPPSDHDLTPLVEHDLAVLAVAAPLDTVVAAHLGPPQVQGRDGAAWDLRVAVAGASRPRASDLPPRARFEDMLTEEPAP